MAVSGRPRAVGAERTERRHARLDRITERLLRPSDRMFVLSLVLLHVAILFVLVVVASWLPIDRLATSDVPLFNERAAAVLAGDVVAEGASVAPDTPPLVNFLMVVPYLMGGSLTAYAAYFSAWLLAGVLVVFYGLRAMDPAAARGAALLLVTHPFTWATAVLMVQDEALVAAFVAFAYVAMRRSAVGQAGAWTGIGALVKAWPIVGAPVLLAGTRGRPLVRLVLGLVVPAALLLIPFLLVDPGYVSHVLAFYGGGVRPDRTTPSGISMWKFLDEATGLVWEPGLVAILAAASLVLWWLVARRRLLVPFAYPAAFLLFFVLYPKIHFGYYLILIVVLSTWLVRKPWAAFGSYVVAGAGAAAHLAWHGILIAPRDASPWWAFVPAVVAWSIVAALALAYARSARPDPAASVPAERPPHPTGGSPFGGVLSVTLGTLVMLGTVATVWLWRHA